MSTRLLRRTFLATFALLTALSFATDARADGVDLVLVLNARNDETPGLAAAKKIFMGDTTFWKGTVAVHVFVRPAESAPGDAFYRTIGVAPARFKRMWQEKQLSGQGTAPEAIAAGPALIAKIAADPGAIGVALASEVPASTPGVRVTPLR